MEKRGSGNHIHTLPPKATDEVVVRDPLPCERCRSNQELINALQEALGEVADQNSVLREKTVELEACISDAEDQLQYKQTLIKGLESLPRKKSAGQHDSSAPDPL